MRVVSPVALSALAVVAVQNLADTAVTHTPAGSEPPQPEEKDVAKRDKAAKLKAIQPTVLPETLSLQQFAGIQAALKLDMPRPDTHRQLQPRQPERLPMPDSLPNLALSALPAVQIAATPEQIELLPLDPVVDTLVNADLNRLPSPAQRTAPDPAIAAEVESFHLGQFGQPVLPTDQAEATDSASLNPRDQASVEAVTQPAESVVPPSNPPTALLEQPTSAIEASNIPDYLLPKQAAALGMDRILSHERPAASSQPEAVPPIDPAHETQGETSAGSPTPEPEMPDYLLPKQAAAVGIDRVTAKPQPTARDYVVQVEILPVIAAPEPIVLPRPVTPVLEQPSPPAIDMKQAPPVAAEKPLRTTALPQTTRPIALLAKDPLEPGGNQSFAMAVQQQEDQLVARLSGEPITADQPMNALPTAVWENMPTDEPTRDRPKSHLETAVSSPIELLGQEAEYLLGAGDRLRVEVFNAPEYRPEYSGEFPVLLTGAINLPLVGGVPVQGMTLSQASQAIATKYAPLLERSRVTVHLITDRSLSGEMAK